MNSFRDIIERWPSRQACADAVGAPLETAKKWHQRDSIPSAWWPSIVAASAKWEVPITFEALAALAARDIPEQKAAS